MKHQPSSFQRACSAMTALRALNIGNSQEAMQAIKKGAVNPTTIELIKTAYGRIGSVRKVLSTVRPIQ